MRKGDQKKQEILATAEKLFCSRGYDETSVQDILDVLHCSKGGFYHHFVSKEAVLDTLCEQHAVAARDAAAQELSQISSTLDRLNTLFTRMIPLHNDSFAFLSMLLPLLDRPESTAMRVRYQEALLSAFQPLMEQTIEEAAQEKLIYPPVRDAVLPVLTLLNQCWYEAALLILDSAKKAQRLSTATLLGIIEKYRRCIEVLLDAPYGSVVLVDFSEWDTLSEKLMIHLARIM